MDRVLAADLPERAGERVRIAGWLQRARRLASVTFLVVRDRSGAAQVVISQGGPTEAVASLPAESVVEIEGKVIAAPQAPGGVEMRDPSITLLAASAGPPPVELHRPVVQAALPTLLDHAAVALRHPRRRAAVSVAAAAVAGFRYALDAEGFTEIHSPKIVPSATESGANVFRIDYFGRAAFLAQSPQFYKQVMVGVCERVYETAPVFRAEPHDTTRHLAEYVSLDAELGFIADHRDVMAVVRTAVAGMVDAVRTRAARSAARSGLALPEVPAVIPEVDFGEGQRLIADATGADLTGALDLAPEHERWLGEWAGREHGSDFLFVVGYPMAKRPFYTHPDPHRPSASNSFDLLFRGMEIVTGGQRLHRYQDYVAALTARGEALEPYEGYLEAFRYGMPPHGGFAIGLERFVTQLVGASNIREVTPFPRDVNRLTP